MPAYLLLLIADVAVVAVVALYTWPLGLRLQVPVLAAVALVGIAGALVSRATLKNRAKARLRAEVLPEPRNSAEMWLLNTVERLSRAAGIKAPEVALFRGAEPNALAVGAGRDTSAIVVSSGLLASLPQDEVEAVLGHAISTVASGDLAAIALAQGVVDTFVMAPARVVGGPIDRMMAKAPVAGADEDVAMAPGPAYRAVAFVLQLAFGFLATLIIAAYARSRRPRGDSGAAHLAGRRKIKAVLERLQTAKAPSLPPDLSAFAVRGSSGNAFAMHPEMAQRLERLPAA